jgi:triacylglycerol lipase
MLMSVVQIHLSPPSAFPASFVLPGNFFGNAMTNALIQRFVTLGSLVLALLMAAWLWPSRPTWAIVCLIAPILITGLILGLQCVWAAWLNRRDSVPSASLWQWVAAWWAELCAAMQIFAWWQPFRHHAIADQLSIAPQRRGVVLVHGFLCNRALWTAWMRILRSQNRAFVAVDLEPAFGSISAYAKTVEAAVQAVEKATGLPPVLIGHSMGGLAIRAWVADFIGKQGSIARVHRIVTIGTPHQGTAISQSAFAENARQMQLSSDWLKDNTSRLPDTFANYCTCYFSHCDNIVFPASVATITGADNRHLAGQAHLQMIYSSEIQQACFGFLEN